MLDGVPVPLTCERRFSSDATRPIEAGQRCHRYRLSNPGALGCLNEFYHSQIANIPGFLTQALYPTNDGRANLWDLAAFVNNPDLFASGQIDTTSGTHGYILMPNIERHQDKILAMCSKQLHKRLSSKCRFGGGISFTMWALHSDVMAGPDGVFEDDVGILKSGMQAAHFLDKDVERAQEILQPKLERRAITNDIKDLRVTSPTGCPRSPCQRKVTNMELESGHKYLVTILDLTPEELPWLLEIRSRATAHMTEHYRYEEECDDLQMYFHFPTSSVTSTLHLHVTLNRELGPHEAARSFALDDIIDHLASGSKDVFDLVWNRHDQCNGLVTRSLVDVVRDWASTSEGQNLISIDQGVFNGISCEFTPSKTSSTA